MGAAIGLRRERRCLTPGGGLPLALRRLVSPLRTPPLPSPPAPQAPHHTPPAAVLAAPHPVPDPFWAPSPLASPSSAEAHDSTSGAEPTMCDATTPAGTRDALPSLPSEGPEVVADTHATITGADNPKAVTTSAVTTTPVDAAASEVSAAPSAPIVSADTLQAGIPQVARVGDRLSAILDATRQQQARAGSVEGQSQRPRAASALPYHRREDGQASRTTASMSSRTGSGREAGPRDSVGQNSQSASLPRARSASASGAPVSSPSASFSFAMPQRPLAPPGPPLVPVTAPLASAASTPSFRLQRLRPPSPDPMSTQRRGAASAVRVPPPPAPRSSSTTVVSPHHLPLLLSPVHRDGRYERSSPASPPRTKLHEVSRGGRSGADDGLYDSHRQYGDGEDDAAWQQGIGTCISSDVRQYSSGVRQYDSADSVTGGIRQDDPGARQYDSSAWYPNQSFHQSSNAPTGTQPLRQPHLHDSVSPQQQQEPHAAVPPMRGRSMAPTATAAVPQPRRSPSPVGLRAAAAGSGGGGGGGRGGRGGGATASVRVQDALTAMECELAAFELHVSSLGQRMEALWALPCVTGPPPPPLQRQPPALLALRRALLQLRNAVLLLRSRLGLGTAAMLGQRIRRCGGMCGHGGRGYAAEV